VANCKPKTVLVDLINKCKNIVSRKGCIIKDADEDEGTYENPGGSVCRIQPSSVSSLSLIVSVFPLLKVVAHVTDSWINKEDFDSSTSIIRGWT